MKKWLAVFLLAGCAPPPEMRVVSPRRGEIVESFTEKAETRLSQEYPVQVPVSGHVGRLALKPGDPVRRGQVLAQFDRFDQRSALLQAQARVSEAEQDLTLLGDVGVERQAVAEAGAQLGALRQRQGALQAQVREAEARWQQARSDVKRWRAMLQKDLMPQRDFDQVQLSERTAYEQVRRLRQELLAQGQDQAAAGSRLARLRQEESRRLAQAPVLQQRVLQARQEQARAEHALNRAEIRSPVDGVVLKRYEEGPRDLTAGSPLLLLGNLGDLEVVCQVLTADAVRVAKGTPVNLEASGKTWKGRVSRVEPAGFTKLSSLGIEQQRVNVVIGLEGAGLGVGYQLQARFLVRSRSNVLLIDRFSALQGADGGKLVWKVEGDRLHSQPIEVGLASETELEVTRGLTESDRIVAVPDATMVEGMKIRAGR
ncbi:MAG: HlyD family efflux transporter periplasmic adaptor subunit [Candidatus Eremiobacteraeota bacterium]|nr:HlyD family efflux transporter periplasmic adaptor subunit [Candidatus Eremiobacteraeota bacterium]MCW5869857.1 HlyD family efflux transporter periplasmic adaptor subunit [Candidatus Eremiobacteraeota bacterium]